MLIGTYRHSIDEKKRMRVPAKFKNDLGANFIITKGNDGCLFAFTKETFEEDVILKSRNLSMFDKEAQKPLRALMASAFETEEDGQGRILIPQELREFACLEKQIVFVGVGSRVEIWAEDRWNDYNTQDFDEACKELADLGV